MLVFLLKKKACFIRSLIRFHITQISSKRINNGLERKERYHIDVHLDGLLYEGELFTDGSDCGSELNWMEEEESVYNFMMTLTDVERRRLEMKLNNPKMSFEKMGRLENVSKVAIFKTFTSLRSKYNAFFCS